MQCKAMQGKARQCKDAKCNERKRERKELTNHCCTVWKEKKEGINSTVRNK